MFLRLTEAGSRADMLKSLGQKPSVFFGEILLRLATPANLLLSQANSLALEVGGAEANVAVGLASLGRKTRMVSCLPDNALGLAARAGLQRHGVDCRMVQLTSQGRMGLYFLEPGAGLRASSIVYDRKRSSFALAKPGSINWDVALADANHLHLSGITAALGDECAALALEAAKAARAGGLLVSFDGNFRAQLWEQRDADPRPILTALFNEADIAFANHRDFSLLFGTDYSGEGPDRRREAAKAAFAAFPRLKLIASTARRAVEADKHFISARVESRDGSGQTDEIAITNIVDRIGTGDAFAAGVLHAIGEGHDLDMIAQTGLALNALKHSIPGDLCLVSPAQLDAFLAGNFDVRR